MLLAIISGLVFPMILEVWRDRRKRAAERAANIPQGSSGKSVRALRVAARLILSPVIGFLLAPGAAAFLQSRGHPPIEFGSDLSIMLLVLFSIIAWFFLSSIGPLKVKT